MILGNFRGFTLSKQLFLKEVKFNKKAVFLEIEKFYSLVRQEYNICYLKNFLVRLQL